MEQDIIKLRKDVDTNQLNLLNTQNDITSIQNELAVNVMEKRNDIPGSANLNNYIVTGIYHQNLNAQAQSGTNYPEAQAGMLEVMKLEDGIFIYQRYTTYNTENVYERVCYNSSWGSWAKIWSNKNCYMNTGTNYGQIKLPNGFLIQWGSLTLSLTANVSNSQILNLPIAYTVPPGVIASDGSGNLMYLNGSYQTLSSIYISGKAGTNCNNVINWVTFGY